MSGLRQRILKVTLHMPGGDVVLDQSLNLKVHIEKDCRAAQNEATIEVTNLLESVRQELLSQFTAFNRRKVAEGNAQPAYFDMEIAAGYLNPDGTDTTSTIYHGQVVECGLVSPPPNVTVRIKCYTHQINKITYIDQPPLESTFKGMVIWSGQQCGFDIAHINCNTSHDEQIVSNFARSTLTASGLLDYIEQFFWPDVAAYIDDNFFIVKDRYAILNPDHVSNLSEFIGMPLWNEWGVTFTTFLDPSIQVAQASSITSLLNPSLNGTYVVMRIVYELTSRDTPFYCHVEASPPA